MKTLKIISAAAVLAVALSVPTYAGILDTPGATPPPPPPESNITLGMNAPTETPSALGDMVTPGFAELLWVMASIF
jgi:hypothetical protein